MHNNIYIGNSGQIYQLLGGALEVCSALQLGMIVLQLYLVIPKGKGEGQDNSKG